MACGNWQLPRPSSRRAIRRHGGRWCRASQPPRKNTMTHVVGAAFVPPALRSRPQHTAA